MWRTTCVQLASNQRISDYRHDKGLVAQDNG